MITMRNLSKNEKMDLAEALWDSAMEPEDDMQITHEQQKELDALLDRFALENRDGSCRSD